MASLLPFPHSAFVFHANKSVILHYFLVLLVTDDLSHDSSGDEYTPDMEGITDDCDTRSDDGLNVPEAEMREVEEGWRLISDVFSDKCPEVLLPFVSQFSGLNPALGGFVCYVFC